jgi:cytochrome c oxidase assembly factor CtaG
MLPPFGWHAVLTQWEFAPIVTALTAITAVLYLWGVLRVRRRHPGRPWPLWRTAFFLGGLVVIVLATQSGIGAYDVVLFWDHMVQHLMLIMIAPPMLVVGQPVTLLLHASRNPLHTWTKRVIRSRVVTFLTWPPFGLIAYAATIVATHLTGLTTYVLTHPLAHDAEHALYLVVGYLFFLPILGREPIRWRLSYPIRFLVLALAMPVDTFSGLILANSSTPIEGGDELPPPGSPGPVQDVHWAGAIMWIGGDAIMFGFLMLVYLMWARSDRPGEHSRGWLETVRMSNFEALVGQSGPSAKAAEAVKAEKAGEAANATQATEADQADQAAEAAGARQATAGAGAPQAGSGGPGGKATPALAAARSNIDDDEHLEAYNAYLARLNQAERRSGQ